MEILQQGIGNNSKALLLFDGMRLIFIKGFGGFEKYLGVRAWIKKFIILIISKDG